MFVSLYGLLCYYVGLRGRQSLLRAAGRASVAVYWTGFWFVALSSVLALIVGKLLPPFFHDVLAWIGAYWEAVLIYVPLILASIDLIRAADRRLHFLPTRISQGKQSALYAGAGAFVIIASILVYGTWNALHPRVTHYDVTIQKPAGALKNLRILMAADLHLGTIVGQNRLDQMVSTMNGLNPDLILLPGDILDDDSGRIFAEPGVGDGFQRLHAKFGVYAVPGNHEYISGRNEEAAKLLTASGVAVLTDRYVKIADSFYVAGRDDLSTRQSGGRPRPPLATVLQGVDRALPVILLDHQPSNLGEALAAGVDLQVSGHTHRGQLFPFQYLTRRIYEVDWGYLKKGPMNVVVTCGYGTWGPPIRIGNHPEIVVIDVQFVP
ncbi:MAG TPA: metallophosphoesterase [Symbiobacteriaceae bacterium]